MSAAPRAVVYDPRAIQEFRAAYRRYAQRNPARAQRFQLTMNQVIQRIASAAEQGSPYRQRYRWMRLRRFPYFVYYEIRDPLPVLVYAVAHTSRRPGYWLRRRP